MVLLHLISRYALHKLYSMAPDIIKKEEMVGDAKTAEKYYTAT